MIIKSKYGQGTLAIFCVSQVVTHLLDDIVTDKQYDNLTCALSLVMDDTKWNILDDSEDNEINDSQIHDLISDLYNALDKLENFSFSNSTFRKSINELIATFDVNKLRDNLGDLVERIMQATIEREQRLAALR
jgi:hypothetical protein